MPADQTRAESFSDFVTATESSLRQALTAFLGPDVGRDAAAEALAYGWEHWDRLSKMVNPGGYLYRVGLNWGRKKASRREPLFPASPQDPVEWFEPGLPEALGSLSDQQRVVVYLVHGHDWSLSEVARLLEISKGSAQTHMERGMERLRRRLKVET